MWFIHIQILPWFWPNLMLKITALCQGTFNFKGSNMLFSSFVCHFSRTLYSLSVPGKQERAELYTVLRTEVMRKGICLDSFQWLPSVTFYLKVIYSAMSLFLRIWNDFWPFQDCYLLGFVFAQYFLLPKAALYEHIETCVSANKAHLFHSRLGSPASFFSLTPVPRSQSIKTVTSSHSLL